MTKQYNYKKYVGFTHELKEDIKKRDNYTCQLCGITEKDYESVVGEGLQIHHIDHNRRNFNKENLITLCSQCNMEVNSNRDYWAIYFKKIISKK